MDTKIFGTTEQEIERAGEIIRAGGLVAFPTETVYGLGANAMDDEAVGKVYAAKGRPSDNPMIAHISSKNDLKKLTDEISENTVKLMKKFWPGPLTMVVKARPEVSRVTTGGLDTVAVRMPSHPVAAALISAAGVPIAAPSANLSGKPSPTIARHVIDDMDGRIDAIIDGGDSEVGIESTVVDMTGEKPMILRPGIITKADLEKALGCEVLLDPTLLEKPDMFNNFHPKAPGMKYKHYAPNAEMIVYKGDKDRVMDAIIAEREKREEMGERVEVIVFDDSDPRSAAHEFFARLRAADKAGVDVILATALTEKGIGFSVMNRMLKSAGYNVVTV